MINQQILQGSWNEISGKIQQKWGQLTRDDLRQVQGNIDQLIGLIQRKTGESREAVEHFFDTLTEHTGDAVGRVTEAAREYTEQLRHGAEQMADGMRTGYARAESLVQQRPAESVAVFFAAGMIAGVVFGLLLNSRS